MSSLPSDESSHRAAGSLPSPPSQPPSEPPMQPPTQPPTQSISQPQPLQSPSQPPDLQRPLPSPGGDLRRKHSQSPLQSAQDKKQHRNRIRYSCTNCREKKVKCNRNSPCDQCEKRDLGASCRFVPYQYPRLDRRARNKNRQTSSCRDRDNDDAQTTITTITTIQPAPTSPSAHQAAHDASQPCSSTQDVPHRPGSRARDARQPGSAAHGEPAPHPASCPAPSHPAGPLQQPGPDPPCPGRPRAPKRASRTSALSPVQKLRYLESVVAALRRQIAESSSPEGLDTEGTEPEETEPEETEPEGDDEEDDNDHDNDNEKDEKEDDTPPTPHDETHGNIVAGSRYIGSDNWEGVMGDVVKLTENLGFGDSDDDADHPAHDHDHWDFGPKTTGLALLSGNFERVSVSDLFRFLPPRATMDIMIDRFFNGNEPAWVMFHRPTFYKHYEAFWNDPRSASYTYLALLYMMLAQAAIFYLGAGEPIPGGLGDAIEVIDGCRTHAAHCLAMADYTKPDKFKVETMLLYFRAEYLRQVDAPLGTAMILSITVRLALHMGYHRDPKHFPHLSAFEGEMRRRTWAVLTEVDKLVSFEFGLPANIKAVDCDTAVPRNLHDSDLHEDMDMCALPPSRPESEFTPVLYTICKARVMWVFGDIMATRINSDALSLRRGYYEKDIMDLDRRLQAARASFGAPLKYLGAPAQVGDDGNAVLLTDSPTEVIMQRCTLELLYQKVRLVLHRRFLGIARTHARFAYSRAVCIDAATCILRHQYDLYVSLLPGGPLAKDRWIRNSTHTHDFLLAGMVMCLEVSYARKEAAEGKKAAPLPVMQLEAEYASASASETLPITEDKMLEMLATSCSIWQMQREVSAEANRAYKILTQLLWGSTGGIRDQTPREMEEKESKETKEARGMAALACFAPDANEPRDPTPAAMLSPEQHMMPMPVSRPINLTTAVPPRSGTGAVCAPTPISSSISSSSSPALYDGAYPQMLTSQPASMHSIAASVYTLPASLSPSDTLASWPATTTSTVSIAPPQHTAPTMPNMAAAPPPAAHMHATAFETVPNMAMYQNPLATTSSMPQAPAMYSQDPIKTVQAQAHPSHLIPIDPATSAYSLLPGGTTTASCPPFAHTSMAQAIMPLQDQPMEDTTDPSYFSDWSLWDNQVQRVGLDAMPATWTGFFPLNTGNSNMH